jgi:U3 small nucleolar ribonucleoprotein protein IMP4
VLAPHKLSLRSPFAQAHAWHAVAPHLAHPVRARATPPLQIGPRFEMRLYQIKLGTMEQQEAEVEWALRPYMRSGKKRKL